MSRTIDLLGASGTELRNEQTRLCSRRRSRNEQTDKQNYSAGDAGLLSISYRYRTSYDLCRLLEALSMETLE
jgi:hypothetical protein